MSYDHGRFVWFEAVVPDPEPVGRFYSEVIGWKVQAMEMAGGMQYPMLMAGEAPVGGLTKPPAPGVPPHWVSYVSVKDVDAAAEKVVKLGGKALMDAFDVPGVGRMMPVADPHGASFFLFKNANGDDAEATGEGTFHWNELLSSDPEAAVAFYEKAFGYTHETMDMGGDTYFVLKNKDAMRAGVMKAPAGEPTRWQQYVTVDDADAAEKRAKKAGGKVLAPAFDIAGVGRITVIQDPAGAVLGLIKPAAG